MPDKDKLVTLHIYRVSAGLWSGRLFVGEEEIGEIGAFPSPHEVEEATVKTGLYPDHIEIERD
ncbi:hypothetical protein [Caballeronia terrestris]|uniref:hypothetical protein n=1 Tax=Caballeronia terrestris TaxID=1226301 RepID=UPI000B3E9967|nr:hypothetical protein [Caballeronia terrestris]